MTELERSDEPVTELSIGFCPHCGGSLNTDAVVRDGPYSYSAEGGFKYQGKRLPLPPQCEKLLGIIMSGKGQLIKNELLATSIGTEAVRRTILVQVLLSKSRRVFREHGIAQFPVKNKFEVGVYWTG